MTIDEFVASLSAMLGVPAEWEDDALSFEAEGGATVTLEYDRDEDLLYLYSDIAQIEERNFSPLTAMLLDANLYAGSTGGTAAFGYDREEEKVVLWDRFPLEGLLFETFEERFVVFVEAAVHWSDAIYNGDGGLGGGGTGLDSAGMIMPNMLA